MGALPASTKRCQPRPSEAALDACAGTAKAVELVASGASNAFPSGPLFVKNDEYLLVDAGVTLDASRNAADYQKPGDVAKCGDIASQDNGCYALVNIDGSGSGVVGTRAPNGVLGTIDGRGWATIINGEYDESWWALGEQAVSRTTVPTECP